MKNTRQKRIVLFLCALLVLCAALWLVTAPRAPHPEPPQPEAPAASEAPVSQPEPEAPPEEEELFPVPEGSGHDIDFAALQERSKDVVAWVRCEGTIIDYPIVQGEDNEYYLKHDLDGAYARLGTIYMDYQNAPDFTDQNTMLFGHNMKTDDMFGTLVNYREQAYYDEHPVIMLYTAEKCDRAELVSAYFLQADRHNLRPDYKTEEKFRAFLDDAIAKSLFESDVSVTEQDRIVTFCTCTYEYDDARFILHGKLVEE